MHLNVHNSTHRRSGRTHTRLVCHASRRTDEGPIPGTAARSLPPNLTPPGYHAINYSFPPALFPPDSSVKPPGADSPSTSGGNRRSGREGDPITNPRPILCLYLLLGKNTRDAVWRIPLPTMNGCTCHLGMSCWTQYQQVASHKQPSNTIINTVAEALVAERVATVAVAVADGGTVLL